MKVAWEKLDELANEHGDCFYLLDLETFQETYERFVEEFQSIYHRTIVAYSYKANYLPSLCRRIQKIGGYAEVSSGMEYALAERVSMAPEQIVFNGPLKTEDELERALLQGSMVNLENHYETKLLSSIAAANPNASIRVGLRCKPDVAADSRFGFSDDGALEEVLSEIRALPNCVIDGLHIHLCTPEKSPETYSEMTEQLM